MTRHRTVAATSSRAPVVLALGWLLLSGATLQAQADDLRLERGLRTRALSGGWGHSWPFGLPGWSKTRSDVAFVAFHPSLGWFVLPRTELFGEATLFAYYHPAPGVTAGLAGIGGRHHFRDRGRVLPFVSGGAGFLWTSLDVPEIDRVFNGQLFYGVGIRVRIRGNPGWLLEVRNHHISNAGTKGENLGLNAVVLVAGVEWILRRPPP